LGKEFTAEFAESAEKSFFLLTGSEFTAEFAESAEKSFFGSLEVNLPQS
jgi:hypothetical protein